MNKEVIQLRELINLRFIAAEKALELQSKETERRLGLLNGEAERLRDMQATYLPREVYEANYKELSSKIDSLQKVVFIGIGITLSLQLFLKFFLLR